MANKGLEVIEARWLFDVEAERIDVLVHPQSIGPRPGRVWSMARWLAQLSRATDMRIADRSTFDDLCRSGSRHLLDVCPLDLAALEAGPSHFEAARHRPLPLHCGWHCEAATAGGDRRPPCFNAANEVAVAAFLERRIPFTAISETVEKVLEEQPVQPALDLDEIRQADLAARARARRTIEEHAA